MPTRPPLSTEAVSPVVATLVLVAMTIVLTASVMVLAGGLQRERQDLAPTVVPSRDERDDRIVVVRADTSLPLSRLRLQMSVPGHFGYNSLASLSSPALPANTLTALGAVGTVTGGDVLYLCANAAAANVQVLLQDPVTNKVVATESFDTLSACA